MKDTPLASVASHTPDSRLRGCESPPHAESSAEQKSYYRKSSVRLEADAECSTAARTVVEGRPPSSTTNLGSGADASPRSCDARDALSVAGAA